MHTCKQHYLLPSLLSVAPTPNPERERERERDGHISFEASWYLIVQLVRVRLSLRFSLHPLPHHDSARFPRSLPLPTRHRLRPHPPHALHAPAPPSYRQVGPITPDSVPGRLGFPSRDSLPVESPGGRVHRRYWVDPVQEMGRGAVC